jgi:hypothetical protein
MSIRVPVERDADWSTGEHRRDARNDATALVQPSGSSNSVILPD